MTRIRPALAAFFGCLYYGALRPDDEIVVYYSHVDCSSSVALLPLEGEFATR